jgi:phenylalanine-4-hydroxylase
MAQRAQTVTTAVLDSGLGISGVLGDLRTLPNNGLHLSWQGAVQLSVADHQLEGQGPVRHSQGFSGTLGRWADCPEKDPATLSDRDLVQLGIKHEQPTRLSLCSGVTISGTVLKWQRSHGKLVVITWNHCTVRFGDEVLYRPEWGEFDQPVGTEVISVYGGPADRRAYGTFFLGKSSTQPGRQSPFSEEEKALFTLYQRVKDLRAHLSGASISPEEFCALHHELSSELASRFPEEWLLGVELMELIAQAPFADAKEEYPWLAALHKTVLNPGHYSSEIQHSLSRGLECAGVRD